MILFISLAYTAITLDITGILQAAAFWVSNQGGNNGRKLYFYFYILYTTISIVIGNDPAILSGTAFLAYYTFTAGLEPMAWLIAEFVATNTASMVLFVGNPTNVIICEGFQVSSVAFTTYTILPFIACSLACYAALAFQFRNFKHIPPTFPVKGRLNPREALRDPVSAIFGTILLLTCLILVIVLSFFHIDVWEIALPFAVTKVIFDLSWDHYRFTHGQVDSQKPTTELSEEDRVFTQLKRALSMPGDIEIILASELSEEDGVLPRLKRALSMPGDIESVLGPELSEEDRAFARLKKALSKLGDIGDIESILPSKRVSGSRSARGSELEELFEDIILYGLYDEGLNDEGIPGETLLFPTLRDKFMSLEAHFPTFFTALPRLPFTLIPFAFSQFILIEGLSHQGWIDIFATWLVKATHRQVIPTIWLIGVLGVILSNVAGTNIGASILLTKVVHAAPDFPASSTRAAAIALAVASNIGAASFIFSASLAGLLWKSIWKSKGIRIKQSTFAFWNCLPLLAMTAVGLGVVTGEMKILY